MYIIKNAYLNIIRGKARNILIGIIITVITICSCIALAINKSGTNLINTYKESNPLEISFTLNMMDYRNSSSDDKESFTALTIDDINSYGNSSYVSDYYYTAEVSLSSDIIEPISYEDMFKPHDTDTNSGATNSEMKQDRPDNMKQSGDFRITGYSNPSYLEDFISGTKKIIDGAMFTKDNTDRVVVISEELAVENSLSVGDIITLYSTNDTTITYDFTIVGIYEDNSNSNDNFMGMNAMNSANQMYTNITSVNDIAESSSTVSTRNQSLNAKFYLNNNDDLDAFTNEVREKGLSNYYSVTTNEEAILATLQPISNISNFSITFLIVVLVLGAIILSVINIINIRERKYEIGVLRAIGMSKLKVALELVAEMFMVAIISLIIGTLMGVILSQPVTNSMLKNEISNYETKSETTQNNFGGSGFDRPAFNKGNKGNIESQVNYVDTLKVNVDALTILKLFAVSLFITISSGLISVIFINKYDPNKILQNR